MANKFFVSPSPHIHGTQTTQKIMADVIIALLPALCVSTVVYGWGVLLLTAIAVASCVRCLTTCSAKRLVNHHARMLQRRSLSRSTCAEKY